MKTLLEAKIQTLRDYSKRFLLFLKSRTFRAFIAGILLAVIIVVPLMMNRPYTITDRETFYSEDAVEYNVLYQSLFNMSGSASTDDFVLVNYYDIVGGNAALVSVNVVPDSMSIYVLALYFLEDDVDVIKIALSPGETYEYVLTVEEYGTYGIAIFGHKLSSNIGLQVTLSMLVQT